MGTSLAAIGNMFKQVSWLPPKKGQKIDWYKTEDFYDDGKPKKKPPELSEKGKALLMQLSLTGTQTAKKKAKKDGQH
mgnify:FL=1